MLLLFLKMNSFYFAFFYYSETFEKKPVYIKRTNSSYYKGLFSGKDFHKIMREVICSNFSPSLCV